MRARLEEWAEGRRYRAGWYQGTAVGHALRRVREMRAAGAFDAAFYEKSLAWLAGSGIGVRPGEESIIMVGVPRPAHIVSFDYRGRRHELVLPPTYYDYGGLFEQVKWDLETFFGGRLPLRLVKAPLKTLATVTGFARYGRNNIAYLDGLGSYVQLIAFASTVPVGGRADGAVPEPAEEQAARETDRVRREEALEPVREPAALDQCTRCRLCREACPTGAIGSDRFLLHAERCMTWFSEYAGPLPEAFGAAKRPCLVGCMVCQEVCPANRGLLRLEQLPVQFACEETEYLLGEMPGTSPPSGLREKLEVLRCSDCTLSDGVFNPVFRRNLAAVVGSGRQ